MTHRSDFESLLVFPPAFNQLKAINPKMTLIMYLNSMFDFSMYNLHGLALDLEATGTRVLLRYSFSTFDLILCVFPLCFLRG